MKNIFKDKYLLSSFIENEQNELEIYNRLRIATGNEQTLIWCFYYGTLIVIKNLLPMSDIVPKNTQKWGGTVLTALFLSSLFYFVIFYFVILSEAKDLNLLSNGIDPSLRSGWHYYWLLLSILAQLHDHSPVPALRICRVQNVNAYSVGAKNAAVVTTGHLGVGHYHTAA